MLGLDGSDPRSASLRRAALAGPAVAAVALAGALAATGTAGVPLRDPGGVTLRRLAVAAALAAVLVLIDIRVRRHADRWTRGRVLAVAAAIVSFHVTYFSYRNVKSVVPLLAGGELHDARLADLEQGMFGGDPAQLLHSLLGTGAAAHVLSTVYLLFFAFIPLALTLALVWPAKVESGLFFATALALNWVLAAVSYRLLPSLGPIYADPAAFAELPATGVSRLQETLLEQRAAFLRDPSAPGAAQSIGAFASLHTSLYLTAALAAHLLGCPRAVKAVLWALLAGTAVATVYFGWHYVADDLGAVVVAVSALALARLLTGLHPRAARSTLPAPSTSPA